MNCLACEKETIENAWGNWCDFCGGVVIGQPPILFFRHVATVEGAEGRFPIVFDSSAGQYGVSWPKKIDQVRCIHCGMNTPTENTKDITGFGEFRSQKYYSSRGSLDAMLTLIWPHAKGNSLDIPTLSAAPTSTDIEKKILIPV